MNKLGRSCWEGISILGIFEETARSDGNWEVGIILLFLPFSPNLFFKTSQDGGNGCAISPWARPVIREHIFPILSRIC